MGHHHAHPHPHGLSRRRVLQTGLAAGAMLTLRPGRALALAGDPYGRPGANRTSRLPLDGRFAIQADMHNHSHHSDGSGDPGNAYASMRDHGLDAAALTDHATLSWGAMGSVTDPACAAIDGDPVDGQDGACRSLAGLDEARWERTRGLAAAHDQPGSFAAMHGFEWSSPLLGHINVWDSQRWIDPLHTAGVDASGFGVHFRQGMDELDAFLEQGLEEVARLRETSEPVAELLDTVLRGDPLGTGMLPFYEWLVGDPSTPVVGGGADGIASFNHPGREPGRFSRFRYHPRAAERIVAMEILNRDEDYLFEGHHDGQPSPLVECLNAGWRVGLIGVTDEHGTDWGNPAHGKGRAGLWVPELSRGGVRDALSRRHAYATFEAGLRLDVAARPAGPDGWRRMGSVLDHDRGPVRFAVDLAHTDDWVGRDVEIQVLRPDDHVPAVAHVEAARIPAPDRPPITFTVDLDLDDGDWVVLRIADPHAANRQGSGTGHPGDRAVIAYASPFWLGARHRSPLLGGALSATGLG
ncbi:MAG: PHP domain-containing protein [Actinobacteria bacterium]|jgi:hypothetical protein|nr:PHP domain-containing protein [Actinomycetota bacterium]